MTLTSHVSCACCSCVSLPPERGPRARCDDVYLLGVPWRPGRRQDEGAQSPARRLARPARPGLPPTPAYRRSQAQNYCIDALQLMCSLVRSHGDELGLSQAMILRCLDASKAISSDPTSSGILSMFAGCSSNPPKAGVSCPPPPRMLPLSPIMSNRARESCHPTTVVYHCPHSLFCCLVHDGVARG